MKVATVLLPALPLALLGVYLFATTAQDPGAPASPTPTPPQTVDRQPSTPPNQTNEPDQTGVQDQPGVQTTPPPVTVEIQPDTRQSPPDGQTAPPPQTPHRIDSIEIEPGHKTQTWDRADDQTDIEPRPEKQIENTFAPAPAPRREPLPSPDSEAPPPRSNLDPPANLDPLDSTASNDQPPTPLDAQIPNGTSPPGAIDTLPSVLPPTPWLPLDTTQPLTRIGVGSCLSQSLPQPIWTDVLALSPRPQLFLMIGDNVYGDIKSPGLRELVNAYRTQARHPDFSKARTHFPFLATWDDHDYGANDAGAEFKYKAASAKLFADFWQLDIGRPGHDGIYYHKMIGPPGRRVHIIMLDTRTFRSPLTRATDPLPYWGRYQPDTNPDATMLGTGQWAWFNEQLKRQADLRLIVSSVQVLSDDHGFERWGNFTRQREKLVARLNETGAIPTILLSGDRHLGAFYEMPRANGSVLAELTTSSMNRSYGPAQDLHGPKLASRIYHRENYALIDIDWHSRQVELSLRGLGGEIYHVKNYAFSKLQASRAVTGPGTRP